MSRVRIVRIPVLPFGMVSCHLLVGGAGCVLVDAGLPGAEHKVGRALTAQQLQRMLACGADCFHMGHGGPLPGQEVRRHAASLLTARRGHRYLGPVPATQRGGPPDAWDERSGRRRAPPAVAAPGMPARPSRRRTGRSRTARDITPAAPRPPRPAARQGPGSGNQAHRRSVARNCIPGRTARARTRKHSRPPGKHGSCRPMRRPADGGHSGETIP